MVSTGGKRVRKDQKQARMQICPSLLASSPICTPSKIFPKKHLSDRLTRGRVPQGLEAHSYWLRGDTGQVQPHSHITLQSAPSRCLPMKAQDDGKRDNVDFQTTRQIPIRCLPTGFFFFKFDAATLITSVAQKTFDLFSDSNSGKEALWKIPTAGNQRRHGPVLGFPTSA